jgi:hypothetical protein
MGTKLQLDRSKKGWGATAHWVTIDNNVLTVHFKRPEERILKVFTINK